MPIPNLAQLLQIEHFPIVNLSLITRRINRRQFLAEARFRREATPVNTDWP